MEVLWEERKMVGHEAGEIEGARSKEVLWPQLRNLGIVGNNKDFKSRNMQFHLYFQKNILAALWRTD